MIRGPASNILWKAFWPLYLLHDLLLQEHLVHVLHVLHLLLLNHLLLVVLYRVVEELGLLGRRSTGILIRIYMYLFKILYYIYIIYCSIYP